MKTKIKYKNFEVSRAGDKYLKYRLDNVFDEYPNLSSCCITVLKENNNFRARMTAKHNKIDITEKWSGPIFLICINKLITAFENKLHLLGHISNTDLPIAVQRSSVFKEVI